MATSVTTPTSVTAPSSPFTMEYFPLPSIHGPRYLYINPYITVNLSSSSPDFLSSQASPSPPTSPPLSSPIEPPTPIFLPHTTPPTAIERPTLLSEIAPTVTKPSTADDASEIELPPNSKQPQSLEENPKLQLLPLLMPLPLVTVEKKVEKSMDVKLKSVATDDETNNYDQDNDLGLSLLKLELGPPKKLLILCLGSLLLKRGHLRDTTIVRGLRPDVVYGNFLVFKRLFFTDFLKLCLNCFEAALWSSEHNIEGVSMNITGGSVNRNKLLFVWSQEEHAYSPTPQFPTPAPPWCLQTSHNGPILRVLYEQAIISWIEELPGILFLDHITSLKTDIHFPNYHIFHYGNYWSKLLIRTGLIRSLFFHSICDLPTLALYGDWPILLVKFLHSNGWELFFMDCAEFVHFRIPLYDVLGLFVVFEDWEIEKSPFCYLSFFSICGYKRLCPAALLVKYPEFFPYPCIGLGLFLIHKLEMGDVLIDGKESGYCSGGCARIADFGTFLFTGSITAVVIINHVIRAVGVVSQECKTVVDQHGKVIMDLPMAETKPNKLCSQTGRCTFDGARGVSVGIESVVSNKPFATQSTPYSKLPEKTLQEIIEKMISPDTTSAPATKVQGVGWPPIRFFRKNSLVPTSKNDDEVDGKLCPSAIFVKISWDDTPYLRKLDLRMYSTYQELSSALGSLTAILVQHPALKNVLFLNDNYRCVGIFSPASTVFLFLAFRGPSHAEVIALELSRKVMNMGEVRRIAAEGIPDGSGIRSFVWKLLLGCMHPDQSRWPATLAKNWSQYKHFKEDLLVKPSESTRKLEMTSLEMNVLDGSPGLLSSSEISHGEHPLNLGKSSIWNRFFQYAEIVERAFQIFDQILRRATGACSHSQGIKGIHDAICAGLKACDGFSADPSDILTQGASLAVHMMMQLGIRSKSDGISCPIPQLHHFLEVAILICALRNVGIFYYGAADCVLSFSSNILAFHGLIVADTRGYYLFGIANAVVKGGAHMLHEAFKDVPLWITHPLQKLRSNHHLEDKVVLKVWGNDTPASSNMDIFPQPKGKQVEDPIQLKKPGSSGPKTEHLRPLRNRKSTSIPFL